MEYSYQFEEWKDIPEYFGLYQVSNLGRIKSLNYKRTGEERILKPLKHTSGYLYVALSKNGKEKQFSVHRLVALAFLENSENLPQINHKDEDKTNNRVENLEFCNCKYNLEYNNGQKRRGKAHINHPNKSKSVEQYTLDGTLIGIYPSASEAERQTGFDKGYISLCCNGKIKKAYGYIWRYA